MSLPRPEVAGGPSTHLPLLRAGLEAAGVRIIPFNYTRRKDDESRLEKLVGRGLDLLALPFRLLRHRPDLVHHNSAFDPGSLVRDGLLCLVTRMLGTPVFIKVHGSHRAAFGELPAVQAAMRQCIVKYAAGIGVLSEPEKQEFIECWPELRNRVHVVRNIVRPEFVRARVRDHGRPMVFFTSRFVRDKGLFDLLDAVPEILAAVPQCRFTFIGHGPESAAFADKVRDLGLGGVVTQLPNRTYAELIGLYEQGGIFVFPTRFPEGMPMALVEAMAVGLLAISSPIRFIRGVPSFDLEPGLVLGEAAGRPQQVARAVVRYIGDPARREAVGGANKAFAGRYSTDTVTAEFLALYAQIADQGRGMVRPR